MMENHTIVETDNFWIVGGKLIINKQGKQFEHWFEQFIYDLKKKLEEENEI